MTQATSSKPQGYLAYSPLGGKHGVLVLHAWWGLNSNTVAFCGRLAQAGFSAYAPDLYHGKIATTIPEAEALSSALDTAQAKAEVAAAAEFLGRLTGPRPLAVIGFSLGAYFALDLSTAAPERIGAVVLFYGTGPGDFSASKAAYLGHFADTDPYEPDENVDGLEQALREAGRPVSFYRYPGTGHWFFEPDRADAYRAEAAALAWQRTLDFLKQFFGG